MKSVLLYIWKGICSLWFMAVDTYPEVVRKMYFLLLLLRTKLYLDR